MWQIVLCLRYCALAVLPVFDAGGTANRPVRSEMLVEKLVAHGSAVVTMGARDPDLPKLARRMLERVGSLS